MIINADRNELLAQVRKLSKASAAPTHPVKVLSGILFEADARAGIIRMTATNLEVSIRSILPATVERDGRTVIDAKFLLQALELLPDNDVYMELEDSGQFHISSGQAKYQVTAIQARDYPKVDIPYPGGTVSVKGLKSLISRSVFASAKHDSVNTMSNCVRLDFSEGGVRAAYSDGTCAVQVVGDPECTGNLAILVPAASLRLFASLANDGDVYELGVTGTHGAVKNVVLSDGTMLFSARLLEGGYPDTDDIFNNISPVATASVDADKFRTALDEVSTIAAPNSRIEVTFGENGLVIRHSGASGNVTATVDAKVTGTARGGFHFALKNIMGCTRLLRGDITVGITKDRIIEINDSQTRFIQLGLRPDTVIKPESGPPTRAAA